MLRTSLVLLILFFALCLAGARDDVGILSGTMPSTWGAALLGLGYALTYFATLFFAPPLFAAGVAHHFFKKGSAAARNASGASR
jgi:hypothetical protein